MIELKLTPTDDQREQMDTDGLEDVSGEVSVFVLDGDVCIVDEDNERYMLTFDPDQWAAVIAFVESQR